MKNTLLSLILLFSSLTSYGQDTPNKIQNLEEEWKRLSKQMEQAFYASKFKDAVRFAEQAYDLVKDELPPEHLFIGQSLDNLGTVLHNAGRGKEGVPYLKEAIAHGKIYLGVEHEDYITRLNNFGMLLNDIGYPNQAEPLLKEAIDLQIKTLGKDHQYYPIFVNNLALCYQTDGKIQQAYELMLEAKQYTEKLLGTENPTYANRLNNLASILKNLGQYDEALRYQQEAYRLVQKFLGREHAATINSYRNLSLLYSYTHPFDTTLAMINENLAYAEKSLGKNHLQYFTILDDKANLYLNNAYYPEAEALYSEIFELANKSIHSESMRFNLYLTRLAQVYLEQNKAPEAFESLEKALHNFKVNFLLNAGRFSERDHLRFFNNFGNTVHLFQRFAKANLDMPECNALMYNNQLFFKGMLLQDRTQLFKDLRNHSDETIQAKFEEWNTLRNQLSKEYNKLNTTLKIDSLSKATEDLERFLASVSTDFRQSRKSIEWTDIEAHLGEQEAAIEFVKISEKEGNSYIAYLVEKGCKAPIPIPLFQENQLLPIINAKKRLYSKSAKKINLQQLVWQPLAPYLAHIKTIYYAPAGILHRINFRAIPSTNELLMGEQFQLHLLNTTRNLVFEEFAPNKTNKKALVFGGINYDETTIIEPDKQAKTRGIGMSYTDFYSNRQTKKWQYLEWTAQEAQNVSSILTKNKFDVSVYSKLQAKEEILKEITTPPSVLHIATHGYFFSNQEMEGNSKQTSIPLSDHPMIRSGLIMAGANKAWQGDPPKHGEDGILTAYEIAQLNLSETELVVLSACDTGLGDLQGDEGVYGLQRAFKMAGAKYVLMTLWSIRDKQALQFMDLFYQEWLQNKHSIPEAFQKAQSQMRQRYSKPFNPATWAGFVLIE